MNPSRCFLILAAAWGLFLPGCNNNVPVYGTVTFPDGKPLTCGSVCFQNEDFVATGEIQKNGTYKLSTQTKGAGVAPGNYAVYIAGAMEIEPPPPPKNEREQPKEAKKTRLIATQYMSPETSGLSCVVAKEMKIPYDLVVDYPE